MSDEEIRVMRTATVQPVQNPLFVGTLPNDVSVNLKNLNLDMGIPRPFCYGGCSSVNFKRTETLTQYKSPYNRMNPSYFF